MMLLSWINRLKKGDTFAAIHASDWNKIANVLETIDGEGGIFIRKSDSGMHWRIVGGVKVSETDNRLVVDWMYDSTAKKIKVLYGTLMVEEDGSLAIRPDMDDNGNPLWNDGTNQSDFGGGGTTVVEEEY